MAIGPERLGILLVLLGDLIRATGIPHDYNRNAVTDGTTVLQLKDELKMGKRPSALNKPATIAVRSSD